MAVMPEIERVFRGNVEHFRYPDGRELPIVAGADDPPEDDDIDDDDDDEDPADDDDDEPDDDDDDEHVRLPRSEAERLRRIAAEADKAKRDIENAKKKQAEKERRERGEFDELLKEKDTEKAEIEAERDEARYQLESYKKAQMLRAVGVRLGLRDPDDLGRYLSDDETENEQDTERAAKRLLRERPHLRQERLSTGMPGGGEAVDGLTFEDLKTKSQEWINDNWDTVQKVLQASGPQANAGSSGSRK